MSTAPDAAPDLGAIIAPLLARAPQAQRPLVIALAERMAAARYRGWSERPELSAQRAGLRACAEREEEIARRVEALSDGAKRFQERFAAENPELEETNRELFAGRPLSEQLALQARGERLGAATWRAFARAEPRPEARETFLRCAELEEQSAAFLEAVRW